MLGKDIQLFFLTYGVLMAVIFVAMVIWDFLVPLLVGAISGAGNNSSAGRSGEANADEATGILQKQTASNSKKKNKGGGANKLVGDEGDAILMNINEK